MSRHNRRRRRSRQHRHSDLLADADVMGTGYESSNSVVSWQSSRTYAPSSTASDYTGFDTPSSTSRESSVLYTPSATGSSLSGCGECTKGTECRSKVSTGDYSFFWSPTLGRNPWAPQPSIKQPCVSDHLCEYLYACKKPFPPGLGQRTAHMPLPAGPWYKPLQQAITFPEKDEIMLPHGEHCDSMCRSMTSVIKSLFDGEMDYNDEDIEKAQIKKNADKRAALMAKRQASQRVVDQRAPPDSVQATQHRMSQRTQQRHHRKALRAQGFGPNQTSYTLPQYLQSSSWTSGSAFARHYAHVFS